MNVGSNKSGKRVIVGLTGRMASCVAAFLLKKQGFEVIGVSIVTNVNENFRDIKYAPKCHINNLDAIKDFCSSLKIPFYATDAKNLFESEVIDPLLGNKLIGHANASCFNCTEMRIKVMYEKMKKLNAHYIATGHFGKIHKSLNTDDYFVHSNNDNDSDQSYLLANLDNKYLKHLLLPLGELKISEVEKFALKFNLKIPTAFSDQKFCFVQKESCSHYIDKKIPKSLLKTGQVVDVDSDNYHGDHEGMVHHYITESDFDFKGLVQKEDSKLEIVGYDYEKGNILIGDKKNLSFKGCQLIDIKINKNLEKIKPIQCYVKTKFSDQKSRAILYFKNNQSAFIEFDDENYPLIDGETYVIYDKAGRNAKVIGLGTVAVRGGYEPIDRVAEFRPKSDKTQELSIFKF